MLYPKINGVARPQMAREFGILSIHPIYFQWQAGQIQRIYAMERDPVVSVNIKKGIISMLQLQLTAGQRTEVSAIAGNILLNEIFFWVKHFAK